MSYESEAADQVVRMTLNGVEIAARLTGRAAERLAALVYAIIKDNKKTRGKATMKRLWPRRLITKRVWFQKSGTRK